MYFYQLAHFYVKNYPRQQIELMFSKYCVFLLRRWWLQQFRLLHLRPGANRKTKVRGCDVIIFLCSWKFGFYCWFLAFMGQPLWTCSFCTLYLCTFSTVITNSSGCKVIQGGSMTIYRCEGQICFICVFKHLPLLFWWIILLKRLVKVCILSITPET